jgi:hypothetical protein
MTDRDPFARSASSTQACPALCGPRVRDNFPIFLSPDNDKSCFRRNTAQTRVKNRDEGALPIGVGLIDFNEILQTGKKRRYAAFPGGGVGPQEKTSEHAGPVFDLRIRRAGAPI